MGAGVHTNACILAADCRLKHLFPAALRGYFRALDSATLADLAVEHMERQAANAGLMTPMFMKSPR